MTTALADLLKRFIDVEGDIATLDEDVKRLKHLRNEIAELLAEAMGAQGIQSMNLADGRTVYLRTQRYVNKKSGVDTMRVVSWLEDNGFEDIVSTTYNPAQFKSCVLEHLASGELPGDLSELVNVHEQRLPTIRGVAK